VYAVQIYVILQRTPIWDIATDVCKFKDFLGGVDLQKEGLIVLFVGTGDEIETGPDKGARKVPQKPEVALNLIQRVAGTKRCGHRPLR
jgi:hypothetical protein